MTDTEKVTIVGRDGQEHLVEGKAADLFFHGSTGEPLTDEEWDESKKRQLADNTYLVPPGFR